MQQGAVVGSDEIAEVHRCSSSPCGIYFVKRKDAAVSVIFPMQFTYSNDADLARTFLMGLVEARTTAASLGKAPECSYDRDVPPSDLDGVDRQLLKNVKGGFVSFSFTKRRV